MKHYIRDNFADSNNYYNENETFSYSKMKVPSEIELINFKEEDESFRITGNEFFLTYPRTGMPYTMVLDQLRKKFLPPITKKNYEIVSFLICMEIILKTFTTDFNEASPGSLFI